MTNNNIIFGIPGVSTSVLSGSLLSFDIARQANIKEATDQNDMFYGVAGSKIKYIAQWSALITTSGSTITIPAQLTPVTITNTMSGDATGNYYISGTPKVEWKNDDFAKLTGEATKWVTAGGTL